MRTRDARMIRSVPALAFRAALFCLLAACGLAQEASTTNEFWPEIDTFLKMSPNLRLIFVAKRERDAELARNSELSGEIEWSVHRFQPVLTLPWVDQDATRKSMISFRAGHKYKRSFDKTPVVHENRPQAEFTLRWIFAENILVSNRARWEFRFVSGSPFSWRYRDRVQVERDFKLNKYTFTSYINGEPFYSSGTSRWDRFRFSGGAVFPFGRWFALEPFYLRQIDTHSPPRNTNALGLGAQVHWPN